MSSAHIDDLELHYDVHGQGPPLLLLHGFFGAAVDWAPFLDGFGRDHQLIVPDLRGHGRSTNPSRRFTHRRAAADILALADALGLERFSAVGLSGGGNVMLHVATMAPERVAKMVLVSATTHYPPQARAIQRAFTLAMLPPAEQAAMSRHVRGAEQCAMLEAQARAFADDHDDLAFTAGSLAAIRARTLIVYGDRDPLYPVEIAVAMYRAIAHASLWVVPHGGHNPVFAAQRPEFTRVALAFLRD